MSFDLIATVGVSVGIGLYCAYQFRIYMASKKVVYIFEDNTETRRVALWRVPLSIFKKITPVGIRTTIGTLDGVPVYRARSFDPDNLALVLGFVHDIETEPSKVFACETVYNALIDDYDKSKIELMIYKQIPMLDGYKVGSDVSKIALDFVLGLKQGKSREDLEKIIDEGVKELTTVS